MTEGRGVIPLKREIQCLYFDAIELGILQRQAHFLQEDVLEIGVNAGGYPEGRFLFLVLQRYK